MQSEDSLASSMGQTNGHLLDVDEWMNPVLGAFYEHYACFC